MSGLFFPVLPVASLINSLGQFLAGLIQCLNSARDDKKELKNKELALLELRRGCRAFTAVQNKSFMS